MSDHARTEAELQRSPFAAGDVAVMYDRKRRRYRVPLVAGGSFSTHLGIIEHDSIIGCTEGFLASTSKGHKLIVLRPTFQERVRDLPRQSQVIYPKDLGSLIMHCDLYPGARVVEAGLGSGASAGAILRAIGPSGSLVSYEVREEIIEPAKRNVAELAPGAENHTVIAADVYEQGLPDRDIDRMLLDLSEPWQLVKPAAETLRIGGILTAFLPTVLQVHQFTMALTMDTRWRLVETVELLERPWHLSDTSARPEHRMVAHTGFITTARRCESNQAPGKPDSEEDDSPEEEPMEDDAD
jgi:tRNA (adenine57-N1/adenine58-N1)-methyltransferase